MQTLGFDNYVEPLKLYLQKYREVRGMAKPFTMDLFFMIPYMYRDLNLDIHVHAL
jgi:hypothetical protein